ncbi:glycosyltransferase, partial [Streptococcus uberis]
YPKEGASSNYRILMYENDLKNKFEVRSFSFWNKKYVTKYMHNKKKYIIQILVLYFYSYLKRIYQVLKYSTNFDTIIIQKSMFPWSNFNFVNFMKKHKVKIIYDIDDAIFLFKGDHSTDIAEKADTIVVGNRIISDHYKKFNNNVRIFPTVDYSPEYIQYKKNTFGNKIIGWIGSDITINNLEIVESAISEIIKKYPEVTFRIITNENSKYNFSDKKNFIHVPWNLNTYKLDLSEFTVGIMPLFDTEDNRGKCAFKLIQYLSMGKPVVASPVGVNVDVVGNSGFLAEYKKDWINYLERLLFDEKVYNIAVDNIKNEFDKNYNYAIVLDKWINLINEN